MTNHKPFLESMTKTIREDPAAAHAGLKYLLHVGLDTVRGTTEDELASVMAMFEATGWEDPHGKWDRLAAFRFAKRLSMLPDGELRGCIRLILDADDGAASATKERTNHD